MYASGFRPLSRPGVGELPFEYHQMTDGEASSLGEAVVETNGRLTKCGPTVRPNFIAAASAVAATPGAIIPVWRVDNVEEWTTQSLVQVATTLKSALVTLHTDGKMCTATTASGVFQIGNTDGASPNSNVSGRFI